VLAGRDRELRDIVEDCAAGRLVVLSADPGFGTTALLSEGVAPELRGRGFIVVSVSAWQGRDLLTDLKEAVSQAVREQADETFFALEELSPLSLMEMLQAIRARTRRHIALLLDQFEDYLGHYSGTDISEVFDAELSHSIAARRGHFVIALHRSALTEFERFAHYIPNLLGSHVTLGPLNAPAARELVAGEAARLGVEIEASAIALLMTAAAVARDGGFHPFFLKAGATRLLEGARDRKSGKVGPAAIEVFGGPDRLVLESLDDTIGCLSPTHLELFFRWGNILFSPEGRRVAQSEQALTDFSGKLNRFALSLLPRLIELRILRTVELSGNPRYELRCESTAVLVRDWWGRRETALIARRRAQFRVRSISVAVGSIVVLYAVWLLIGLKN
jgi:hypothetical protein